MVADMVAGFRDAEKIDTFSYYELNISCPNLKNIQNIRPQLASPEGLKQVLDALMSLHITRPTFIKMPLERSDEDILALVKVTEPYPMIRGMIFSNLAKDRSNPAFDKDEIAVAGVGNFSGKPVESRANELLQLVYRTHHGRFALLGVGGVFSAEDAYAKIRSGASLVQMITGMVFQGPQVVGEINMGLAQLLRRDGFSSVRDAVGVDVRTP
jgi:dihydroorotate dehydrogenase